MRNRIVVAVLALVIIVAGAAFYVRGGSSPAGAQAANSEPLLYNEIAAWCPVTAMPNEQACDHATFETETDGSVRVVLNDLDGLSRSTTACVKGFAFTDAFVGTAYVINNDNGDVGFHIPLTAVKPEQYVCEFLVRRTN